MSGIIKLVHRTDDPDGPFMVISEVAEYFECHSDTIRRWGRALNIPTHKMLLGDDNLPDDERAFVWLYTRDDIQKMEEYSQGLSPGRPKQGE